jgi:mono/diheme cytochrome c family protein
MPENARPRYTSFLWIAGILLAAFIGIQFVRPPLTNPPITAEIQAPDDVKQILRNHCYACHSNETRLPLLDNVVPAYWTVVHDVNLARTHLNFSEIGKLPTAQQRAMLFEAVNQVQMGAMPLPAYLLAHPGAKMTRSEIETLRRYLLPPQAGPAPATDTGAADAEYAKWVVSGNDLAQNVRPEPNGFTFLSDYKNWKAISSTDRVDNHTMRVILGNDIAVKAIAEHHINPWPNGTAFAKVAWLQQPDGKGVIHTGVFYQVEFMLRDSVKYASTAGWGWGRWRGTDLTPYGKTADLANECVSCHAPLRKNDYVYTMPFGGQQ